MDLIIAVLFAAIVYAVYRVSPKVSDWLREAVWAFDGVFDGGSKDYVAPWPKRPPLTSAAQAPTVRVFIDASVESRGIKRLEKGYEYLPFSVESYAEQLAEDYPEARATLRLLKYFDECDIVSHRFHGPSGNGLLSAALMAYAEHQGLVLAPAPFLHTIMHGVARFIFKADSAKIAPEHRVKLSTEVVKDTKFAAADIARVVSERLIEQDAFARDIHSTISSLAAYRAHEAAFSIQLMAAFNARYKYGVVGYSCGIRRIEIEGAPEEWFAIADAVRQLRAKPELAELDAWLTTVEEILRRIAAYDETNDVLREFMQRIVQYKPGSCSPSKVSGWITNLFPYLRGELRQEFPVDGSPELLDLYDLNDHLVSQAEVIFTDGHTDETFPVTLITRLDVEEGARGDLNLLRPVVTSGFKTKLSRVEYYAS